MTAAGMHRAAAPGLERLLEVVQELSMARTLERVQEIVRHAARELTGADGATFVLRDDDQCYYADEDAIEPLWKGRRFPMSSCISGWAMLNRQPAVIEDIYVDPRIPIDAYRPTFVKSLAMMPIRTRQPLGAIGNYWASKHRASADELRLLQALADSTSIAIENVTLLQDLQTAKDAAESASRLKDQFLATMSHELRTPLTPILAWAELLRADAADADTLRSAAETIHTCAQQQLRHVDMLLDVSQMIAGRLQLQLVPTDLAAVVDAALREIAPAAASKGVAIAREPSSSPIQVLADPNRLQQVAWNLLANAVKFTPSGGTVTVALHATPTEARLVVRDTGSGIAPEFLPHLFERFRQQDGSWTRSAGGMGLGLAFVHHLVQLHGGAVAAASAGPGRGATFTVTLPTFAG